jgi:serine/threonine protein kinase
MAETARVFGNRWRVVRELGKGGQGIVYEVIDSPIIDSSAHIQDIQRGVQGVVAVSTADDRTQSTLRLVNGLRPLLSLGPQRRGALKELLPIDQAVNAHTAIQRMKIELETLRAITHPALISVLDDQIDQRWFVTEYFKNGCFSNDLARFQGRSLDALRAFRPIVDAVAALHTYAGGGIVHRDIKPDNVFVADDRSLVLGDCGLAVKLGEKDRVTRTFENVGTRDYQPGWSYSKRFDEVNPTFDTFSLGKLLWAMIAGRPSFALWYFKRPDDDLTKMFPRDRSMALINKILENCVVEFEEDSRYANAVELLDDLDATIRSLERGAEAPSTNSRMSCRFCGLGTYSEVHRQDGFSDSTDHRVTFECGECGHLETFLWRGRVPPPAWSVGVESPGAEAPAAPPSSDPQLLRLLTLVIEELGRNCFQSGPYAAALETRLLDRLIEYGETHTSDRRLTLLMDDLYRLRNFARAQEKMEPQALTQHQSMNYKPAAEQLKNVLGNLVRQLGETQVT